jgi:hypothetical protein
LSRDAWRFSDWAIFGHGKFQHHHTIANCSGKVFNARIFFSTVYDPTGLQIDFPSVQRADDGSAADDTVSQRATTMWAFVLHGEKAIAKVEDRDLVPGNSYRAAFPQRDGFRPRDANPSFCLRVVVGHRYTFSIGSI